MFVSIFKIIIFCTRSVVIQKDNTLRLRVNLAFLQLDNALYLRINVYIIY